ncbi:hypothetical protein Q3G72_022934 [Acer saccharum]|nr:hypothetical protein Q3G72_022934 [Acer saccharum]
MREHVLIFDYNWRESLYRHIVVPIKSQKQISNNGGPCMPFEIEVVEAALLSRVQRLEQKLMDIEPRVELSSRAGALRQMLLDLLEDPHEICRMCIMGRNCTLRKGSDNVECSLSLEKQIAEGEEKEIEMLLENYLQRCETCHGKSERLLDSAKEMEDSIAVNLRDKKEYTMRLGRKLQIVVVVLNSQRLEVSRVELLLQVGAFCMAVGALIAGIFGMNLRSYLEEHVEPALKLHGLCVYKYNDSNVFTLNTVVWPALNISNLVAYQQQQQHNLDVLVAFQQQLHYDQVSTYMSDQPLPDMTTSFGINECSSHPSSKIPEPSSRIYAGSLLAQPGLRVHPRL